MPRPIPSAKNSNNQGQRPAPKMGGRPYFFDDPAIDQTMAIILAMSAELSVVYDRLDTVERLLMNKHVLSNTEIEEYRPDDTVLKERQARHKSYLDRLFRIVREERDGLVPHQNMSEYDQVMHEVTAQDAAALSVNSA